MTSQVKTPDERIHALELRLLEVERERDEAMNQLRMLARGLPEPPNFQRDGGSDWQPWIDWLNTLKQRAEAAERERDMFKRQLSVQEERTGEWHRACEAAEAALEEARHAATRTLVEVNKAPESA